MSIKTNTILELEREGRYSEAGYGRLFAYDALHINAKVDARKKAKFVRELNPLTTEDTQKNLLYSGPTVFYRKEIELEHYEVDKMDLKSAYLSYLLNNEIKKPGIFRLKHDGALPLSDRVQLYVIRFNTDADSLFVKWFLNSAAITMKKIKTDGSRVWGDISIFSSKDMNLLKYVNKFLDMDEAIILKTYSFHGRDTVEPKKSQIRKLYLSKEGGNKNAKAMLVQSTGWLSIIDKPTYYHMVQYIKYYLLWTTYTYGIEDDLFGVQTDCLFYRVTGKTDKVYQIIESDQLNLSNEYDSTIGTYSTKRVKSSDIIANKARVVLKNGEN